MVSILSDILFHSALVLGALLIVYFFYVINVQNEAVVDNIFNILQPNLDSLSLYIQSEDQYNTFANSLQSIESYISQNIPSFMSKLVSQNQSEINRNVLIAAYVLAGLGIPILIGGALFLEYKSGGNVYDSIITNTIVFLFILASEFTIVSVFFKNFTLIDGEFIMASIVASDGSNRCNYVYNYLHGMLPMFF